jgi:UDP-GlcNAc:undecaprenyl-phosphate GlcNAc-1-phosphate transferase
VFEIKDFLNFAIAFSLTLAGQWLLNPFAQRLGLLDHPAGRKDHSCPTPTTGGIAMLVGVLIAGIFLVDARSAASLGFGLAAIIVILLGVLDDKYDLSWKVRIGGQTVAALIMIYLGGIRVEQLGDIFDLKAGSLGLFSVPFTVFITIGIINAINMIDGADGLAGLLVLCALVMLDAAALYSGNVAVSHRLPILIGAVAGFLIYNLRFPWQPRAKIFMGNAGSAFLGFAIACFVIRLTQSPTHPVSPVLGPWLVIVPIIDCLVLMIRRTSSKRSPFSADRDHIHHLMIEAGFGPTQAAFGLALFSGVCGLFAATMLRLHVAHVVLVAVFVGLGVLWYWLTARRTRAVNLFRWLRGPVPTHSDDIESSEETDQMTSGSS